jgi:hypothetical protein
LAETALRLPPLEVEELKKRLDPSFGSPKLMEKIVEYYCKEINSEVFNGPEEEVPRL